MFSFETVIFLVANIFLITPSLAIQKNFYVKNKNYLTNELQINEYK